MKEINATFKALSENIRVRILMLLLSKEELCVCAIMEALDTPQCTISRHLSILKSAGLVTDRRAGVWMNYSISNNLTPLQKDIMDALQINLQNTPEILEDIERLNQHFWQKSVLSLTDNK